MSLWWILALIAGAVLLALAWVAVSAVIAGRGAPATVTDEARADAAAAVATAAAAAAAWRQAAAVRADIQPLHGASMRRHYDMERGWRS